MGGFHPTGLAAAAEENQRALVAALAWLRDRLGQHAAGSAGHPPSASLPPCPALDALAATFSLSPFERAVVLLCAGVDLDAGVAAACAAAQGEPGRPQPTFGLALTGRSRTGARWGRTRPCATGAWSRSPRRRGRR